MVEKEEHKITNSKIELDAKILKRLRPKTTETRPVGIRLKKKELEKLPTNIRGVIKYSFQELAEMAWEMFNEFSETEKEDLVERYPLGFTLLKAFPTLKD